MALDKNMVDEKPGNKVRVYEGVSISYSFFEWWDKKNPFCVILDESNEHPNEPSVHEW